MFVRAWLARGLDVKYGIVLELPLPLYCGGCRAIKAVPEIPEPKLD